MMSEYVKALKLEKFECLEIDDKLNSQASIRWVGGGELNVSKLWNYIEMKITYYF